MIALIKCKENVSLTGSNADRAAWHGCVGGGGGSAELSVQNKNRSHYYTLPFFRPRVVLFVWSVD